MNKEAKIIDLFNKKVSLYKIMKIVKVGYSTACNILKKNGLDRRDITLYKTKDILNKTFGKW